MKWFPALVYRAKTLEAHFARGDIPVCVFQLLKIDQSDRDMPIVYRWRISYTHAMISNQLSFRSTASVGISPYRLTVEGKQGKIKRIDPVQNDTGGRV